LGCSQDPSPTHVKQMVGNNGREAGWAFVNVQGMRKKEGELKELLMGQKLGVLGLAETWLLPGEEINVEGYKWVGAARQSQIGRGGVGMFVSSIYTAVEERVELGKGMESVWTRISGEGVKDTLVGVVYISPSTRGEKLVWQGEQLKDLVIEKQQDGLEVIVMGDFNAHFDENQVALDSRATLLENLSQVANLAVMNWRQGVVGRWTWSCGNKQSVLDYVLVSEWWEERISRFSIDDEGFLDIGSDHNVLLWYTRDGGRSETSVQQKARRKGRREWKWRVSGKVDWEGYRRKVDEKMDLFANDMVSEPESGWTAKGRYKVFQSYLNEAASESLGKSFCGKGKKGNKGWWDDEVKEAVKRRREASRTHRFYKKLSVGFPDIISQEIVKTKWESYLQLKQAAKELVKQKMEKERAQILEEMRAGGGYNSAKFWRRAKGRKGKGLEKMRDESGTVVTDETEVADMARAHFEMLGRGQEWENVTENDVDRNNSEYTGRKLEEEAVMELNSAPSYEEVVKAIKRMKKGKGVGMDKISSG